MTRATKAYAGAAALLLVCALLFIPARAFDPNLHVPTITRVTVPATTEVAVTVTGYFTHLRVKQQSPTDAPNTAAAFRVAMSASGTAAAGAYEYFPAGGEYGYTGALGTNLTFYLYNESGAAVSFSVTSF